MASLEYVENEVISRPPFMDSVYERGIVSHIIAATTLLCSRTWVAPTMAFAVPQPKGIPMGVHRAADPQGPNAGARKLRTEVAGLIEGYVSTYEDWSSSKELAKLNLYKRGRRPPTP